MAEAKRAGRWPVAFAQRFFLGLILGLLWIGPAWWDHRFIYAMAAWNALLMFAWLRDLRHLPQPGQLEVSRAWLEPLSQGAEASVTLKVHNQLKVTLEVTLEDDLPPSLGFDLRSGVPRLQIQAPAGSSACATYSIRPIERGDTQVGRVFLRYRTPLKLAERWASADLKQSVRVYPNLQESKRHTLYLIRSRQIELERRLKRQPGVGREFESLREYRDGDETRDVCWTATARRAKLIAKTYQVERSQSVLIVVDAGRLMLARVGPILDFGRSILDSPMLATLPGRILPESKSKIQSPKSRVVLTKLDYAVNAALSLAQVALHAGDSVGLLAYGRRIQSRLPLSRGTSHLRTLLEILALVRGELVEADHERAADTVLTRQRRRSLIVWLTDLAETAATPEVIEAASRLAPRHVVLFAAIGQPELGLLVARRPSSIEEMYRYVAAQEIIQRRELLLRRLRERGALALELEPGRLASGLVNQYLQVKERSLL